MEQVEEICDEIVLINKGSIILDGKVSTVKQNFKEGKFRLSYQGDVSQSFKEKFNAYHISENTLELKTSEGHIPNDILSNALNENIIIESYQEILPTLNEIFIKKVSESHE